MPRASAKPEARPRRRVRREPATGGPPAPETAPRDDRRKQILKAAVRAFAEKGYHGCRISDIAEDAGVAYGLVYHYYGNKDGLLSAIFDTNWAFFVKAIDDITATVRPAAEKLSQIVDLAFSAFEMAPLTVKVLVLEFGRNARLGEALDSPQVARVFRSLTRVFEDARSEGLLAAEANPAAMSVLFMGSLETAFVSFVLTRSGARAGNGSDAFTIEAMKKSLLALLFQGAVRRSPQQRR